VSILYATDETADTVVAAVVAHTHARRPRRIPIKLIVICQRYTPAILEAQVRSESGVCRLACLRAYATCGVSLHDRSHAPHR
jgi:hypothetical protein